MERTDEERKFRLRPRKPSITRTGRAGWSTGFKLLMHYARSTSKRRIRRACAGKGRATRPHQQRLFVLPHVIFLLFASRGFLLLPHLANQMVCFRRRRFLPSVFLIIRPESLFTRTGILTPEAPVRRDMPTTRLNQSQSRHLGWSLASHRLVASPLRVAST